MNERINAKKYVKHFMTLADEIYLVCMLATVVESKGFYPVLVLWFPEETRQGTYRPSADA